MSNEETNSKEKTVPVNPLLEEARAERMALEKVRDEAKAQADRLEQLQHNALLSGTAGLNKPQEIKEETPKEYKNRIMRGGR